MGTMTAHTRSVLEDWHERDLDELLDEILPERFGASRRSEELREAVLQWADSIAYEHGEERFQDGEEAGDAKGSERGYQDAIDALNYENKLQPTAWNHRLREAGIDAKEISLPYIDGFDPSAVQDDVTLTMPEHEAYRVLQLVRGAA